MGAGNGVGRLQKVEASESMKNTDGVHTPKLQVCVLHVLFQYQIGLQFVDCNSCVSKSKSKSRSIVVPSHNQVIISSFVGGLLAVLPILCLFVLLVV